MGRTRFRLDDRVLAYARDLVETDQSLGDGSFLEGSLLWVEVWLDGEYVGGVEEFMPTWRSWYGQGRYEEYVDYEEEGALCRHERRATERAVFRLLNEPLKVRPPRFVYPFEDHPVDDVGRGGKSSR